MFYRGKWTGTVLFQLLYNAKWTGVVLFHWFAKASGGSRGARIQARGSLGRGSLAYAIAKPCFAGASLGLRALGVPGQFEMVKV